MPRPLYLTTVGLLALCLSACTKVPLRGNRIMIIHPGENFIFLCNMQLQYNEFLLETGVYPGNGWGSIGRNDIIIRKEDSAGEVLITGPLQIDGDHNIIDGLTWDGDVSEQVRESDPGTLAISGRGNIVRNCIFRNMRTTDHGTCAISVGRRKEKDRFINTVADDNTIEYCAFYNWGLRGEPKGSTKSSTCIAVGEENDKGKFTGTIIRNNRFIEGPYRQYGYNAAVKIFNSTLLENNLFYKGQECLEIKYGNSTIRGNIIHHFSGYNILANRLGRNNLYENNIVYDINPIDKTSSAQGIMIWEAGNTVYRHNLIYNCAKAGLILGRQTSGNNLMEFVLIQNNSFIGNATGISFNNLTGSPRHLFIVKNIFYGGYTLPNMYILSGFDTASIDNYSDNLYYSNILNDADSSSLVADPEFVDTVAGNYALQASSPACGYGAIPCAIAPEAKAFTAVRSFSDNVVVYPTKSKYIFHVGLVGLDVTPLQLEVAAADGRILLRRNFPDLQPNGLKVIDDIDMTSQPAATYMLKITTSSDVIAKRISIP